MPVTQKDIAARLGVSVSLVSRVLSGKAADIGVAEATVLSILSTADELGYVPSAAAQALRGKSTRTLGVLVGNFRDPFFGPLIQKLHELAREAEYSLALFAAGEWIDPVAQRRAMQKHGLDGLVLMGGNVPLDSVHEFREKNVPLVRIGSGEATTEFSTVQVDEEKGFELLLQHLADQGVGQVGWLGTSRPVHERRFGFFSEQMRRLGLSLHTDWVLKRDGSATSELGCELVRDKLQTSSPPSALLASNDALALGALSAFHRACIDIPTHLRVTGFDDIPEAPYLHPSLTTIRQSVIQMATTAFTELEQAIAGESFRPKSHRIAPQLVVRDSSASRA